MALRAVRSGRNLFFNVKDVAQNGVNMYIMHGSMATHAQFDDVVGHLAGDASVKSVIMWDALGCGMSDKPAVYHAYAEHEMVADAASIVREHGPGIVLAHSFGTNVALQVAGDPTLRELVKGMVLLGPAPHNPSGTTSLLWHLPPFLFDAIRPMIGRGFVERAFHPHTPGHVITKSQQINGDNRTHVIRSFYQQVTWGCSHVLRTASQSLDPVPTIVAVGDSDKITTPDHARAVAASLPWAQLHVVPQAGHMVMMEQPEVVAGLVKQVAGQAAGSR